jgi:hypothetical protein
MTDDTKGGKRPQYRKPEIIDFEYDSTDYAAGWWGGSCHTGHGAWSNCHTGLSANRDCNFGSGAATGCRNGSGPFSG